MKKKNPYRKLAKELRKLCEKDFGFCKKDEFSLGCVSCNVRFVVDMVEQIANFCEKNP